MYVNKISRQPNKIVKAKVLVIAVVGLNFHTAPLNIREKVAFQGDQLNVALKNLKHMLYLKEGAILSTCNRTEIYCSGQVEIDLKIEFIIKWWQQYLGLSQACIYPYLYSFKDQVAVQHIMRVASGLDSMVLGETQILGQLKSAYHLAEKVGMVGKSLSRLFQHAFQVAKKVRTDTDISKHSFSVSYLGLKLAKQIYADLRKTTVLFIGAGENIELALKQFTRQPLHKIYIANRSVEKAKQLASHFNAEVLLLSEIDQCLDKVDIIIASTNSTEYIIHKKQFMPYLKKRKAKRLLIIDLAVPRDIDPALAQLEDVFLYNLDDLKNMVQNNQTFRNKAVEAAAVIIEAASGEYMHWLNCQSETHAINEYIKKIEEYKQHSLSAARNRLRAGLLPEEVLERLANELAQKLAHIPILSIKKAKLIKEILEK